MKTRDALHRFVFERLAVRGQVTHLDATWRAVLERRAYPPRIRRILGEAMAAAALLSATIKFTGLLTLQIQSQGPLRLVVVQCNPALQLRGLARWEGEIEDAPLTALCREGIVSITIDPGSGQEPYQGLVSLEGASLAAALETYFAQSEQLPTMLRLNADAESAAGLLLQRLPQKSPDPDAWNRIAQLGATVTVEELRELDAHRLLPRLFSEDDIRLFEAQPLAFRCACSRERAASMLRALGQEEIRSVLAEQGRLSVGCEFCGRDYAFDSVDAEGLLISALSAAATRH